MWWWDDQSYENGDLVQRMPGKEKRVCEEGGSQFTPGMDQHFPTRSNSAYVRDRVYGMMHWLLAVMHAFSGVLTDDNTPSLTAAVVVSFPAPLSLLFPLLSSYSYSFRHPLSSTRYSPLAFCSA